MWPRDINSEGSNQYTVVHNAFMNIIDGYEISAAPYEDNWNEFLNATGFKKIVVFGGWAFSTEEFTYNIFREGVTAADRQLFAEKVVAFVIDNNLNGVDFDWE
jgi:GH18 family chitinase